MQSNENKSTRRTAFHSIQSEVTSPIESLHFYESVKWAQQQIDYDSGHKDLDKIILDLETLREFFLTQHLDHLQTQINDDDDDAAQNNTFNHLKRDTP